ncbi:MAG TPA: MarR family transcriptional regulator [Caulobacteraceae bacterium]|nr:MarR family transcriptional regulator [Caulobacteraceae bacterium]
MPPPVVKSSVRDTAEQLHSAAIRLLRRLRKADSEAGLTGPQASALSVLVFGGDTTLKHLAAAEQVSAPTMSRLVKDLEHHGLVRRRPDPADARSARIEASEKGRELLERARARRLAQLEADLAALSEEERRLLAEAGRLLLAMGRAPT